MAFDLYDILDQATNEELAPIVEFLVGSPFSYLKHARTYLRHHPNHGAYRDQIADDIYRLGFFLTESMSAPTGSMPDEKHSYDNLLATICKRVGIPTTRFDIAQREAIRKRGKTPGTQSQHKKCTSEKPSHLSRLVKAEVRGAKPRALRRARQRSWAGPGCWAPLRSEGGRRDNPGT